MSTALGWTCYLAATAAIGIYLLQLFGRQGWKRPWNAAGLFFTALVLIQTPFLLHSAIEQGQNWRAIGVTACLLIATGLQAMTALRRRRRADDAQRGAPGTPAA